MSRITKSLRIQELQNSFDHVPYGFCIVQADQDAPTPSVFHLIYANPAAAQLCGTQTAYEEFTEDIEKHISALASGSQEFLLCYNAAVKGQSEKAEIYVPSLKKYILFSSFQYAPGYAGLVLEDITASRIDLAVLKSTAAARQEIYYLRLDQDYYWTVCTDTMASEAPEYSCYTQAVNSRFDGGIICREDESNIRAFLSIDNIRSALAGQDYTEYKYRRSFGGPDFEWCLTSFTVAERTGGLPAAAVISVRSIDNPSCQEDAKKTTLEADGETRQNRAKTAFFSAMSHDMRTPLNVITGMCNLAKIHSDDKAQILNCLKKINTASNHLLALINEVLDMSKIENGNIDLNEQPFSLPDLIGDIVLMTQGMIANKYQHLIFNQHNLEHEDLIGDKNRLTQVLLNLISNAVKYTGEDGNILIDIYELPFSDEEHGLFRFIVKDNGIGMNPKFIEKIFEPFEREKTAQSASITGTGLGMTITKEIVDLMGGNIHVESIRNEGSVFTVEIPMRLQLDIEQIAKPYFPNEKILVIDDFVSCQYSICRALESMHIRTAAASSGKQGVQLLLEASRFGKPFTGVIVDYSMPDEDGISITEVVRTIYGPGLPIIMVSSHDISDIQDKAAKVGVDMFFTKPLFRSQLALAFHAIARKRKNNGRPITIQKGYTGINALLVEDSALNAEIAGELLKYIGLNITIAYNGREAVQLFEESPCNFFDCIFMDLQMPVLNGLEAARTIRALKRPDHNIPIFAMTANVFADEIHAARQAGMQEHIAKPLELGKIEKMLNKWFPLRES